MEVLYIITNGTDSVSANSFITRGLILGDGYASVNDAHSRWDENSDQANATAEVSDDF